MTWIRELDLGEITKIARNPQLLGSKLDMQERPQISLLEVGQANRQAFAPAPLLAPRGIAAKPFLRAPKLSQVRQSFVRAPKPSMALPPLSELSQSGLEEPLAQAVRPLAETGPLPVPSFPLSLLPFGLDNSVGQALQPLVDAVRDQDGNIPAWFPVASFAAYVLITREVQMIRREQERKAMAKVSKVASEAVQRKVNATSEAVQRKVETLPPEAWTKLVACLVIDGLGDSSFLLPGLGELSDVAYAPLSAWLLGQLFQSNAVSSIAFWEEALPITDALPTATLAWVLQHFFPNSFLSKRLGLQPPPPSRVDEK